MYILADSFPWWFGGLASPWLRTKEGVNVSETQCDDRDRGGALTTRNRASVLRQPSSSPIHLSGYISYFPAGLLILTCCSFRFLSAARATCLCNWNVPVVASVLRASSVVKIIPQNHIRQSIQMPYSHTFFLQGSTPFWGVPQPTPLIIVASSNESSFITLNSLPYIIDTRL